MSILIKEINMPKDCCDCPCHNGENGRCQITKETTDSKKPHDCPLIEVPTPHGPLKDADELMLEFAGFVRSDNNSDFATVPTWNDAFTLLRFAPTIIEAEQGDNNDE